MNWRFRFLLVLFSLLLGSVILRLFYWQVVKAADLKSMGKMQYGKTIAVQAKRGEIRTTDGFPIVTNKVSYLLYANPKQIENKEQLTAILSPLLEMDPASISANLDLDLFWVPLAKNINSEKKGQIERMNITGIGFQQEFTRYYPEASMAAQLVGFLGKNDSGEDKGYFGLEGYYDMLLKGKEGEAIQVLDAFGKPVLAQLNQVTDQVDGSSLILSIDRSVQYLAEKRLKEGIEKYQAESGMVGIMEPKTGRILAMASFPNFDPREFWKYSDKLYKNPFVTDLYEPGSTFKPLVMSAAMHADLVTPDTKCKVCAGPVSIGGYDIHTWNDKYYPNISMNDVIVHSDNTGMVFVAEKLGLDRLLDYLKKFGIWSITGIDLQGEIASDVKETWYPVDLATASFGQGISVTPIELLSAISSIANEGKRMQPQIVAAVEDPNGKITKISPKEIGRPIDAKTAKVMTEIMINAVNKGEANFTKLKNYRVAGKTGTASIPIQGHYDPNQTIASFVGFAPADNPKFVMLVIIDRPKSSIYGAETAAPVFFSIAKDILLYYGISPGS